MHVVYIHACRQNVHTHKIFKRGLNLKSDMGERKKETQGFYFIFFPRGCLEKKSGVFTFVQALLLCKQKTLLLTFPSFFCLISLLFPRGSDNLKITLMLLRPD